jgi:hypothetical protein
MEIDDGTDHARLLIRDRFDKIEKARPAIPKVLLNAQTKLEKSGLVDQTPVQS